MKQFDLVRFTCVSVAFAANIMQSFNHIDPSTDLSDN